MPVMPGICISRKMRSIFSFCMISIASKAFLQRFTKCKKATLLILSASRSSASDSSSTARQRIIYLRITNEMRIYERVEAKDIDNRETKLSRYVVCKEAMKKIQKKSLHLQPQLHEEPVLDAFNRKCMIIFIQ